MNAGLGEPRASAADLARRVWFKIKERIFIALLPSRNARFRAIFRRRMWKNPESFSGFGSTLQATGEARAGLASLIAEHSIRSILDAPCGDFNWMRELAFEGNYLGLDIVPELIARNVELYRDARRDFAVADIVAERLPVRDLVLCRECLNHLPLADGRAALGNLADAAGRLLVVTHYPAQARNAEQPASFRFRPLNLTLAPFWLREPDRVIDESGSEAGKVLAVWDKQRGDPFDRQS